jgi:hypothetical protein
MRSAPGKLLAAIRDGSPPVPRLAEGPGVADRLLQVGCAIGYARGQFHLGLPDGWPLPEELPDLPVPAAHLLPVLACVRSQDAHPSVRAWAHLATAVLAAVARRDVYPSVDSAGCDRWALVLPDGALPGQASYGTLLRDVDQFRGISFALAVADEAQNIKNPRSLQAAALLSPACRAMLHPFSSGSSLITAAVYLVLAGLQPRPGPRETRPEEFQQLSPFPQRLPGAYPDGSSRL